MLYHGRPGDAGGRKGGLGKQPTNKIHGEGTVHLEKMFYSLGLYHRPICIYSLKVFRLNAGFVRLKLTYEATWREGPLRAKVYSAAQLGMACKLPRSIVYLS